MEDASSVSKEDTSSGSLPAEKKSSSQLLERKLSAAAATGDSPETVINDDDPRGTLLYSKTEESGVCISHAFPSFLSSSSSSWYMGVAQLRIACGVCLLAAAGVLLCIAAAAAMSVYGGYDFTEGVIGQFMSTRVAPLVTHITRHPWLRGAPSSATIAAAIAAVLITAAVIAATFPLLQRSAAASLLHSRVGWIYACSCRSLRVCLRRCRSRGFYSPLLLLLRRQDSSCCSRSRSRSSSSISHSSGDSNRGERRRGVAGAAVASPGCTYLDDGRTDTGAASFSSAAASAAGQHDIRGGGLQRVDRDNGLRTMHVATAAASAAPASAQQENIEGEYTGRKEGEGSYKEGTIYVAQQSLRHSLQIFPWWSAPFLRLKQVIKSFLHIVAARFRAPGAAELSLLSSEMGETAAARATAAAAGERTGARAATGGTGASTGGLAATGAAAKPATVIPGAAAGGPSVITGGTAAAAAAGNLLEIGREKNAAEAERGRTAAAQGDIIETRRDVYSAGDGGEGEEREDDAEKKERELLRSMTTVGKGEKPSTDVLPHRRRSRDTATQFGKVWDSAAAAIAAKNTEQQGKQQERNVFFAKKERGRIVEGSSHYEEGRKTCAFPPVKEGYSSSRLNEGDAAAAAAGAAGGRRGDTDSSSGGSLQGESEVEDWLVLQEADGRRK